MALIVQTDSNLTNANSYVSLEEAKEYFESIGNTDWYDDEASLVAATQAFDLLFGSQLASSKLVAGQRLQFPRKTFFDSEGSEINGVDYRVKIAVMELAVLKLTGQEIIPSPSNTDFASEVTSKLDVLETTRKYTGSAGFQDAPRKIKLLVNPLFRRRVNGTLTVRRG